MSGDVAVFIGRFQPFHNGHLYSLKKACEAAHKVVVGIGSSEKSQVKDNPYDFELRKEMVMRVVEDKGLDNVVGVVPIKDFPSDEDWAREVKRQVNTLVDVGDWSEVLVVGNNDWTNEVMKKEGMRVYETGLKNRDELEGVKIRKLIKGGNESWKERVPEEVVGLIS